MFFDIICAVDKNYGFGYYENKSFTLPWKNEMDMKFFKNKTTYTENPIKENAIIMGKNTWYSINKVLPNRLNIVLSSENILSKENNLICLKNIDEAIEICKKKNIENIYVIGGTSLIHSLLEHPRLRYVYLNKIDETHNCNIYLKPLIEDNSQFKIISKNSLNNLVMYKLENKLYEDEYKYLNLLKKIFNFGNKRQTRNSITLSLFGESLTFNLKDKLPILTTKHVFVRGIIEELLWFLKGDTNSKNLEDKNINIWKLNSSKAFLESMNLSYNEGLIGPMYGFNWINFGGNYEDFLNKGDKTGFNQIEYCLNLLKNDPYSRRIIMTTFDPANSDKGVLYPCHGIVSQFYINEVNDIKYLSCNMYQRSADMFLGVPFNITSYSLLCYIFCEILNNTTSNTYKPDKLNIYFGDCHIYNNHIEAVHKQLSNEPYIFPKIKFNKKITDINEISYEDISIIDYKHHSKIKAEMIS